MSKVYAVNEIFASLQGEGIRAGTPNVFVRMSGCNLKCSVDPGPLSPGGFDCDTEFVSSRKLSLKEIEQWILQSLEISRATNPFYLVLTGGEPGLQVDNEFVDYFHTQGYKLAIETNGSIKVPENIDWITLSPKVAEHAIKQLWANELKYVRGFGQGIPKPVAEADNYVLSPAFDGNNIHPKTLAWCTELCLKNPKWRLSVQTHKLLQVR